MSQFSVPWPDRGPVAYRGPARGVVVLAKLLFTLGKPIVTRFPGTILLATIVVACLAVWLHMALFTLVEEIAADSAVNDVAVTSTWGLTLTVGEIHAGLVSRAVPLAKGLQYLLWPLQAEVVRDLLALGGIFGFFNMFPVFAIWWERKVAGHIQSRMGPMRVGGWHGWAQSFADGIKLVGKEDLVPAAADGPLFRVAAYFALTPALLAFMCLPFGTYWVFRNVDVALLFIVAMLAVEVVGVIVSGWASNNKWSVYGAMREACQMVSYEIPMTTVLLIPIMSAGTLNMIAIGDGQAGGLFNWVVFANPFTFIAFFTYFIASLASCKRAPFDLPESESELVAGFLTEYSGFRWALFFFAEYAAMFVVAGLCVTLFLGAWYTPLPAAVASSGTGFWAQLWNGVVSSGPHWFIFKSVMVVFTQIWIRWTLPRIRIDQVLYSCVQVMFPIALLALVGHAVWMAIPADALVVKIVNVVLGLIGVGALVFFLVVAAYGWWHRRRMVGYLAVEQLPGS